EAIEPSALDCELLAAQTSQELRSVALRFGQGELALSLIVTFEDRQQFAGFHVLPLGDWYLFHAHARSSPDHAHPGFWLEIREGTGGGAGDFISRVARRLVLDWRTQRYKRQGYRFPSADRQEHGHLLPLK